jgi:hypothetical protein
VTPSRLVKLSEHVGSLQPALRANASLSQRSSLFCQFYSNFEIILSGKRKCEAQNVNSTKKSRIAITLEIKHEILSQHESGMKVNELASNFKLSHSIVSTILKDKEKHLKEVKSTKAMQSTVIRKHDGLIPEVEKLLITWINDQTQRIHMSVNQGTISAKALSLFETS